MLNNNRIQELLFPTEYYQDQWDYAIGNEYNNTDSNSDSDTEVIDNELLDNNRIKEWVSLTKYYQYLWNCNIEPIYSDDENENVYTEYDSDNITSETDEDTNIIWNEEYNKPYFIEDHRKVWRDYFYYMNPIMYKNNLSNPELDLELYSLFRSKPKHTDIINKKMIQRSKIRPVEEWKKPPIWQVVGRKPTWRPFYRWGHHIPPSEISYDLKREGFRYGSKKLMKKLRLDRKLWRHPKLDNKFINENFIDLRLARKKYAIREANFWTKFLKAKHNRKKKYTKRINKVYHTIRPYFNMGEEITAQVEYALGETRRTKLVRFLSKLIFNKIDYPQVYFVNLGRFWKLLDLLFETDSKHTFYYMLIHNGFITNYWCWWIKNVLKLLNKTQPVLDYWYSKCEKEEINFWTKYLNYIKKLSFNNNNIYNYNIILLKFITKIGLLIITFSSFLYNFIYYWIENAILINISKFIEVLSYFFN